IEGAVTSQFEQHVRAVAGLPLGSTELIAPTVSVNILGDVDGTQRAELAGVDTLLETPRVALHWYGKREVRPLRKMGHFTLLGQPGDDPSKLLDQAMALEGKLTFRTKG
ncbi:MAG: 5-(carboxyamino)imidazole ribonucleotide synthase, partial [Candidatus Thermoplasmatota archaeon]|nr:5-(carboxyamino)imidazole ribonucleotide synthase [Candidatus Thermoplasmatota archaeon]